MGGCFGNSFFDRSMENELFRHLQEEDAFYCECGYEGDINDESLVYNEDRNTIACGDCGKEHEL